jgi:hypothetical protein
MATRFPSPVVRRGQVPLTQEDVDALAEFTHERGLLADLCLVPAAGDLKESTVLHALLEVGIKTLREARDEIGYAQLAADPEYKKYVANLHDNRAFRRRPPYADEA